jgi:hypothetical protein
VDDLVARAIASAFLAGPWRARSMTSRAAHALGERVDWRSYRVGVRMDF